MNKSIRSWLLGGVIVLIGVPLLLSRLIAPQASLLLFLLLLFSVDPMFFLLLGASAGKAVKQLWFLLPVCAVFFALGAKLSLGMAVKPLFVYTAVYLGLSLLATGIAFLVGKRRNRKAAR